MVRWEVRGRWWLRRKEWDRLVLGSSFNHHLLIMGGFYIIWISFSFINIYCKIHPLWFPFHFSVPGFGSCVTSPRRSPSFVHFLRRSLHPAPLPPSSPPLRGPLRGMTEGDEVRMWEGMERQEKRNGHSRHYYLVIVVSFPSLSTLRYVHNGNVIPVWKSEAIWREGNYMTITKRWKKWKRDPVAG